MEVTKKFKAMYTIQQHETKSGKLSPQWNLIKESTGEIVTRFVSKVQANSWLQEFQSFINGKTNENHQTIDSRAPLQQPIESLDIRPDSGVSGSSEQPRTDAVSNSADVSETTGNIMVAEQDQGGSDTPSTLSLRGQKDQELNQKFKSFVHKSTECLNRGIREQHEAFTRQHEAVTRQHEAVTRQHEIVTRQHEIVTRQHEIVTRQHEIVKLAVGLAASVVGVDLGDLDLGAKRTIHEPHGRQLEQETIEVKSITI